MLSEGMDRVFRSRYSHVQKTLLVSNIAFIHLATPSETPPRPICRVIGHLSNLTAAKGVFDVVELAEWADREKLDFEFRIAGPFEDEKVKGEFCTRTCRLNNIRYFGPLYGAEKQTFLEELDAFVFPTHYRNEAEPLVLLEALSHGCPVISYDRGSIPAIVDEACGVLLPREAAFLPTASTTLLNWQADSHAHLNRCRAAREKSAKLLAEASIGRQRLLNILRGEEKDVP
jgi:glycosyltransferase involved in cell wall biosynthesis